MADVFETILRAETRTLADAYHDLLSTGHMVSVQDFLLLREYAASHQMPCAPNVKPASSEQDVPGTPSITAVPFSPVVQPATQPDTQKKNPPPPHKAAGKPVQRSSSSVRVFQMPDAPDSQPAQAPSDSVKKESDFEILRRVKDVWN